VTEGRNGAGSTAAPGAAGGAGAERGSVQESVPERRSAGEGRPGPGRPGGPVPPAGLAGGPLHGGILGVADRFRDDDGSADPAAAAALGAFAAGTGSEHAALAALAGGRLLIPVVAEVTPGTAAPGPGAGEKSSDMALPTLVGRDGRRAVPAFTSVAALARWQPAARPMPAAAAEVWRAAAEDSCAVIIDVAGPVPLAVEGARLAALAQGDPVPPPDQDPDVQAAVAAVITAALAAHPPAGRPGPAPEATGALVGFVLHPGAEGGDLVIELAVAPMIDAPALAAEVGAAVLRTLGPRLRRGVALTLSAPPG
jgi:hypothetical protein